jgi:2-desacetyl-2-hydroxyethyl bacteriochlorophyllide A dehydrogenase
LKSIVIQSPGNIVIEERPEPEITHDHEVKIKVNRVGICGSDMHIVHGTYPLAKYPMTLGHEVTGEIVATGGSVKSVKAGDHVVVNPTIACGECYPCRKNRPNICENLSVYGIHQNGGMQEYIVLSESRVDKLDSDVSWNDAVLTEPLSIGAQAIWRGAVEENDTVLIQGAGPIGLSILLNAKLAGAKCLITDINESRLQFAKTLGADAVLNVLEENLVDFINEWTDGEGVNVSIDAVCLPKTFELGVQCTSAGGRVVVLGFDETPASIPQLPITKKELNVVGSRLQTNQFPKVIAKLNDSSYKTDGIVSHEYPLSDVLKAFEDVDLLKDTVRKAVIVF